MKAIINHLYTARKAGRLDDFHTRGRKGSNGHPLVHWKAQVYVPSEEERAMLAKSDAIRKARGLEDITS
jgi:hypothetical protein